MLPQPTLETRSYAQQETDAQRVTCPVCHAPVGQRCVAIHWKPSLGVFLSVTEPRDFHPKRLKRSDTYRSANVHSR